MSNELIIALLAFGFIGSLAAVFILWAKLDEQKKLTQEERDRRLDEISLRLNVEKELEQSKTREKCSAQAVLWNTEKLIESYIHGEMLQERLSALLCPRNDHVWVDGRCVKCGRSKSE